MKYLVLVWSGIWRKKTRTILTALSIATAFFLFGMLQGINLGITSVTNNFTDLMRLRITNRINQVSPMPLEHVAKIAAVPGVSSVTPLTALVGTYQRPSNLLIAFAVDATAWMKVYPEFRAPPAQVQALLRTPNGALAGAVIAQKYGWKVGDRVPVQSLNITNSDGTKNWEFTIVGIYDVDQAHSFATSLMLNYNYVNEARVENKNTEEQIIVRLTDPKAYITIAPAIDELFANSSSQTVTQNEREFIQTALGQIGDIGFFVNGIVGAVFFTLLFLTANTMMQSIRERIPELGVLKALGFSDRTILTLVLIEALVMIVIAAAMGLVLALIVFPNLMSRLATLGFEGLRIPIAVLAWGAGLAIALALVSGLPPAWRAKRLKIVDALAGR